MGLWLFEGYVHFFSHWFPFRSSTERKCEEKCWADGLNAISLKQKDIHTARVCLRHISYSCECVFGFSLGLVPTSGAELGA
jgi:hypothetical protein